MAVNLSPVGGVAAQFFDNNGVPLSGGFLYTYAAGTSTPQATYTSSTGGTAQANPIVLDSSGRVPSGEIWLTDGLQYKFVLQNANAVLIGTYDNIIGINSNFVNYTNQQEIQTATASQTVFTLTTMQYQVGTGSLSVFVDGVNQYGPGAQYAFTETSSTVVTFVNGLHVGASVKFTTSAINASSYGTAADISYTPAGTGAVVTNVQAKLRQTISIFDFIPVALQTAITTRTSTTDVITYIQAAITYASSIGGADISFPAGKFNISATINWASYVNMYGIYGETPYSGITANVGTVFNWTAGNTGTMINVTDVREATLSGFCLDGQSGTAVVGILYTSTSGSSAENLFTKFAIRNCFTGVKWGTTGGAGTDAAQGEFSNFTIWSAVPNSWGFIVNSGNVGQQCKIEWGGIQCGTAAGGGAINILYCNLLQIKRVFGGGTHAAYFIRAEYAQGLTIQGCSSEMWGPGSAVAWRHNDAYFLSVEKPAADFATTDWWTITMIGNQINNPIRALWKTRIASTGDSWGQCRDYITEADVNATGYFTSTAVNSKVVAINNGVNPASIDISTNPAVSGLPTQGWLQSAYVSLDVQNGSGWVTPAYLSTNFTANVSTWIVDAGDVETYCYQIHGTTMTVSWKINTTSLGGIPSVLFIKIPSGKLPAKAMVNPCYIRNATTSIVIGLSSVGTGDSNISIQLIDGSNFAAATGGTANTTATYGQITFEVA